VPSRGSPVRHSLQMSTKPVNTRATIASRTECVRHGVGHETPFSRRGSRNAAEDDPLQLNTEGLTAGDIFFVEQLADKNKDFIIVLQETHCTTADKLVIPNFSVAGSVLSGHSGIATLSMSGWNGHWSICLQNNQRLNGCAYTLPDIRSLTSTNLHTRDSHQRPSRRSHTPACMLATSTADMSPGVTTKHPLTVRAWTPGQHPTTFDCCTTQRKQLASSLSNGTSAPTQTWPS